MADVFKDASTEAIEGVVAAVHRSATHTFSKGEQSFLRVLAGQGVEGDAHLGETVKHCSRVAQDPTQPNLRQVHLLSQELLAELRSKGFHVHPGDLGENITTTGINLLALPRGTRLQVGRQAVLEVTGLRNPCAQIDSFQSGLLAQVLDRDERGDLVRKAGIMSVVRHSGTILKGDAIEVELPPEPHYRLERV